MPGHSSTGTQETETEVVDTAGLEAQPSTTPEPVATAGEDANTAAQPSSAKDEVEDTLASAIQRAVEPKAETPPESSDREHGQDTETPSAEADKAGEEASKDADKPAADKPEAKQDEDVPFHKHPRWQEKLKKERELTRQVESYKAGHDQYEQINTFMRTNGLSNEEVVKGFEIMALLRNDPEKALAALQPYVQQLETVTGRRLPDDLRARVEDGLDSPETAAEAARLRHEALRQRERAEAASRMQHEAQERDQQQSRIQGIQSAVSAVEGEIQSTDPDYARKQPFVMDRVRALIIEKQPATPEEAVAIVRQAHSEISDRLKPMIQRKPVTTVTSADSATRSRPEPKSLLDVVRQAAGQ